MSYQDKFEDEGMEFHIDDQFRAVDEQVTREPRRRAWRDEKKPEPIHSFPLQPVSAANNARTRRKFLPSTLADKQWRAWRYAFDRKCAYCGDDDATILEHVVPVSAGGGTTIYNVLPACAHCNGKKSDMDPERWFAIIGWEPFLERLTEALARMQE
jgi:hypothetical protein